MTPEAFKQQQERMKNMTPEGSLTQSEKQLQRKK